MAVEEISGILPTVMRDKFPNPAVPRDVMLVMPWQKQTSPLTAFSVMGLADRRRIFTLLNFGDAFVAHSRNTCADHFLGSSCQWLLTIDDDMVVPFGNGKWFNAYTGMNLPEPFVSFNALDRLLASGKKLVGALYFGRIPGGKAMFAEAASSEVETTKARRAPFDEVRQTQWVGTGCMLIHRSVFEDIEKRFPRLARKADGKGGQWFTSSEHMAMDALGKLQTLFATGPATAEKTIKAHQMVETALKDAQKQTCLGMGEDVQFCLRAGLAGHQPHVDMGLVCGHVGHYVYGPDRSGK
jgi:hypothetical protein